MSLDFKEELHFFRVITFTLTLGVPCEILPLAKDCDRELWFQSLLTVLEFTNSNTERRWQEPWGPDIFRPNFFTAVVFTQLHFFCVFLYVLVLFARGLVVFVSGMSEFLFTIEKEHLQQLDSKSSFYKFIFITGKLFSANTSHSANKNFI